MLNSEVSLQPSAIVLARPVNALSATPDSGCSFSSLRLLGPELIPLRYSVVVILVTSVRILNTSYYAPYLVLHMGAISTLTTEYSEYS